MCYGVTTYKVICTEFLSIAVPYEKHKLNNVDSLITKWTNIISTKIIVYLNVLNIYGKTRIISVFFKNKAHVKRAHT